MNKPEGKRKGSCNNGDKDEKRWYEVPFRQVYTSQYLHFMKLLIFNVNKLHFAKAAHSTVVRH